MKTISFLLDEKSIGQAIKELQKYQAWVESKTKLLLERLALIGAHEASVRFTSAIYDGDNDVSVEVSPTDDGWVISAKGNAVAFVEFGSGLYHNPSEPYPIPRPAGVSKIGEYGKGKGKQQAWGYYGEAGSNGRVLKTTSKGDLILTHGNPAAMPMWYATEEMRREIATIAAEVFGR